MRDDDFGPAPIPELTERQLAQRRAHVLNAIDERGARHSTRRWGLTRPGAFAVVAAALLVSAGAALAVQQFGAAGSDEICSSPGEWARSDDASWLHSRLTSAGWSGVGCTGSAFAIQLDENADAYVWTTRPVKDAQALTQSGYRDAGTVGATVVFTDGTRLVWRAGEVMVWAAAGPAAPSAPTVVQVSSVVSATTASPSSRSG